MLYLKASQSNTINVTWTERATNATIYKLILTNIAKNTSTVVYIDAISNASSYEERYDRFTFTLGALEKGQYKYEVYQDANGYAAGDALGGGLLCLRIAAMPTSVRRQTKQRTRRGGAREH